MNTPTQGSSLSVLRDVPKFGPRRRAVRHKMHSPAYVSFDDSAGGMVLDLNEIIDLSEAGMSIKSATPLVPDRSLNFVLDLSETKTYINTSGHVVWADDDGRAGIQFIGMPEYARRRLKEWLFVNALSAFAKGTAQAAIAVREEPEVAALPAPTTTLVDETDEPRFALSAATTPVLPEPVADAPTLNAIQQRVDQLGPDLEAVLNVLAESARSLTRSSGAAIAVGNEREMVCRASSGDAPPVGSHLQTGSGFSGECVRTGRILRCDDTETDPIVDRETCAMLGIGSMIAAPILSNGRVIGLLEVFSPLPMAFGESDTAALHRLAQVIARAIRQSEPPTLSIPEPPTFSMPEPSPSFEATLPSPASNYLHENLPQAYASAQPDEPGPWVTRNRAMMMALVVTFCVAVIAGLGSWILRSGHPVASDASPEPGTSAAASPAAWKTTSQPMTLEELQQRASQGDPMAEYAIGARYVQGDEVQKDYAEAVKWFTRAAEQGHVGAQTALGAYYWAGRGVPKDLSQAFYWSVLAREGGDETAKYRVESLRARMSRSQVQEAQRRADEWLRQHRTNP
jgi:putative methionine-R-sulfoxide reductase with GAF domain